MWQTTYTQITGNTKLTTPQKVVDVFYSLPELLMEWKAPTSSLKIDGKLTDGWMLAGPQYFLTVTGVYYRLNKNEEWTVVTPDNLFKHFYRDAEYSLHRKGLPELFVKRSSGVEKLSVLLNTEVKTVLVNSLEEVTDRYGDLWYSFGKEGFVHSVILRKAQSRIELNSSFVKDVDLCFDRLVI